MRRQHPLPLTEHYQFVIDYWEKNGIKRYDKESIGNDDAVGLFKSAGDYADNCGFIFEPEHTVYVQGFTSGWYKGDMEKRDR